MRALRFAVFLGSLAAAAVLAAHIWFQIVQPDERAVLLQTPKLRPQTRVVGVEIAPRSLEQPRRWPRQHQRPAPLQLEHAMAARYPVRLPVSLVTTATRIAMPAVLQPIASQPTTAVVPRSRPQKPPAKPASNPRPVPAPTPPAAKPPSPPAASPVPPTATPTPPVPAPLPPTSTLPEPPAPAPAPAGSPVAAPAPQASAPPAGETANPTPPPAEPPSPPSPPAEPPSPPTPPPSDRPGWGWGDTNHDHTGPPGGGNQRRA